MLATFVVYLWMVRLGSDLTIDEAFNFRAYAKSPLTALGLYHEPNNHPLESFLKSIFYGVLGLDQPAAWRITGFLIVAGYLALIIARRRDLLRRGFVLAATALVLTLLLTHAYYVHAIKLRGYFLSIALQFLWAFLLARDTGFLRETDAGVPDPAATWRRTTRWKYGLIAALLVFTLPANLFVFPPLWLLTVAVFRDAAPNPWTVAIRRGTSLVIASGLLAVAFYTPIFLSLALGISKLHHLVPVRAATFAESIRRDLLEICSGLAFHGTSWIVPLVVVAAIVAAALVLRRTSPLVRIGLAMIGCALLIRLLLQGFIGVPDRTQAVLLPPVSIGILMLVCAVSGRWTPRAQTFVALTLVLSSYVTIPALVAEEEQHRVPTEIAAFLHIHSRGQTDQTVIIHDRLLEPLYAIQRVFRRSRVISGPTEMKERFSGTAAAHRLPDGSWKRRLRDLVVPEEPLARVEPDDVRYLVVIDNLTQVERASTWQHPALTTIKARLSRVSEFQRHEFRDLIFKAE